jgi:hypothetical protein
VDAGGYVVAMVRRPGTAPADAGGGGAGSLDELVGDFTEEPDASRAVIAVDAVVLCAAAAGDDLETSPPPASTSAAAAVTWSTRTRPWRPTAIQRELGVRPRRSLEEAMAEVAARWTR